MSLLRALVVICATSLLAGAAIFEFTRRRFARKWDAVQIDIEQQIAREVRI